MGANCPFDSRIMLPAFSRDLTQIFTRQIIVLLLPFEYVNKSEFDFTCERSARTSRFISPWTHDEHMQQIVSEKRMHRVH